MLPNKIDTSKKTWIKILIHSDSYVATPANAIFLDLNKTEYVDIDVTPTTDKKLIEYFLDADIEVPEYRIADNSIAMYYTNGFKNACFYSESIENAEVNSESTLTNNDLLMSRKYDIFLTDTASEPKSRKMAENMADLDQTKAFLRILFSNNNIYLQRHNIHLGEGWYYLLRFKKVFHQFQDPWSIVVTQRKQHPNIYKTMVSLSTRLEFVLRAYEKAMYYSMRLKNVESDYLLLYHFGFFVMLCTGAFDDLAWLNNYLHEFKLYKNKVSLRHDNFQKKLKKANINLYNLLNRHNFKESLASFYPIRDSLQHRNYLSSYNQQYRDGSKQMIYLGEKAAGYLLSTGLKLETTDHQTPETDSRYSIHSSLLCDYLYSNFVSIIQKVLQKIDWASLEVQLSEESKDKLDKSRAEYSKGVGSFLGFGNESMYF